MAHNNKEEEQNTIEKVNDSLSKTSEKIVENKKVIFWIIGGVAVIAAFIIAYIFIYRNPHLNRAYEDYNQVEITAMGNDSVAAAQYKKVADNNSGNTVGKLASLSAAEAYYNQGKYKEAAEYLGKFSSSEPVLDANAKVLEGDCYVNLKQYDKALDCYKKAISKADGNPQIVPRVLLKQANVYDAQKKYGDALKCYEQIKADFPQFQLGNGMTVDAYIERENARIASNKK